MAVQSGTEHALALSYLGLRRAVGWIGLLLPFGLALGNIIVFRAQGIEGSISSYLHTDMRGLFVGSICATAAFLMSYRYKREDTVAAFIAGLFAVGLSLFPPARGSNPPTSEAIIGGFHWGFAASFFLTLAYFCLFLFTRTTAGKSPTTQKLKRNVLYRVCGCTMLGCLVLIGVVNVAFKNTWLESLSPVFWLETAALWAFGISWLVKGETILRDKESKSVGQTAVR